MKIRLDNPAEYDRHELEIRFIAVADGKPVSVTVTESALFIVRESLGFPLSDPLLTYAVGGNLLKEVVADVIHLSKEIQSTYLITDVDVLRVTGSDPRLPHVPLPWKPYSV